MDVRIERDAGSGRPAIEVVERKGRGHPDTLCDALADAVGNALARTYLDRFGAILHHNVDKVLLVGGASAPAFGGGAILVPIEITLAGRATRDVKGAGVDVEGIALAAATEALRARVPRLDPERHVRWATRIRPGAAELVGTFMRQAETGVWLANDTSIGVGYAPLSPLEATVLAVERALTSDASFEAHPARGEDVKVMGVRRDDAVALTVADAMVGGALADLDAYADAVAAVHREASALAPAAEVRVNAADDLARGEIYITVTGTSAEAGDDGEAGRGNRANGLITPMRPMTMESVAGKNPVSHVGKIYNVVATRIAEDLARMDGLEAAEVTLVSRIGEPVREPQLAHARLFGPRDPAELRGPIRDAFAKHLNATGALAEELVRGAVPLF
ncbi:MAG: methionine adenosyltransferase [Myxococcales bacterium]|nr:methionine adenosyltransferase [Myxococcales bacterium]